MDFLEASLPEVLDWIAQNVAPGAVTQIGVVLPPALSESGNDHDDVMWLPRRPDPGTELIESVVLAEPE